MSKSVTLGRASAAGRATSAFRSLFAVREVGILIGLLSLVLVFSVATDTFFSTQNLLNVLRQISILAILSIGMTMVIVSGEFDLSVGAVYGMSAMLSAFLMTHGLPIALSIVIALLAGMLVGVINGAVTTFGRVPSLIVTLGMLNVVRGATLMLTNALPIAISERTISDRTLNTFRWLGHGKLFGQVPSLIIMFVAVAIVVGLIYHKTIIGFHMRAVGGNANAAMVTGINVKRVKITAFAILGLLGAFGGMLNLSFMNNVQGTMGQGLELDVIAATIIGGASLVGGEGTILGTIIGVLIIGVLRNGLVLLGVSPFAQLVCIGAVIVGAVAVDMWTRRK